MTGSAHFRSAHEGACARSGSGSGQEVSDEVAFILNDPPYGTERTYNGLRLARAALVF